MKLPIAGKPQLAVACLTLHIAFPGRCRALVAADVEIFVGEDIHKFLQNVFGKLHCLRIGHIHNITGDAAVAPHNVRTAGVATEFRISRHCRTEMAGHVYFRNYFNMAFLGISHHFLEFFPGVKIGAVGFVYPILPFGHAGKA
ncbi:hypothetical protein IMSAGC014_00613 [Bacteroidaceae bacterium]|nr:hypothetical protein IMSAGC014_00613 [Bacteroidaceae bacterium]